MSEREPFPTVADLMRKQPSLAEVHLISRTWALHRLPGQAERRAG